MIFSMWQNYILAFVWIVAFLGYGRTTVAMLSKNELHSIFGQNLLLNMLYGFIGIVVIVSTVTIVNFFIPISSFVSLIILLLGVIAFVMNIKYFKTFNICDYAALCAVFIISATLGQIGFSSYGGDTSAYHIQIVKWIQEYTVPVGVVHLYERLASNNSLFIMAATLELPYFELRSILVTNSILMFFWGIGVVGAYRDLSVGKKSRASLFLLLSLVPLLIGTYKFLGNLYIEFSTAAMTIVILYLLIKIYEIDDRLKANDKIPIFIIMLVLAIFSITLKLSMLIFGMASVICGALLLGHYLHEYRRLLFWSSLFLGASIMLPWVLKSILMSGTILYPVSITRLPFLDWCVSKEECDDVSRVIIDWARAGGYIPTEPYRGFEWVPHWFLKTFSRDLDIARALATIAISVVIIIVFAKRKSNYQRIFPSLWLLTPVITGLLYWFLTAPDGRFAFALWYGLAILFLVHAIYNVDIKNAKIYGNILFIILVVVSFVTVINDNKKKISEIPDGFSYPGFQRAQVEKKVTESGYFYYEPIAGSCADSPLPCRKPNEIFIRHNKDFFEKLKSDNDK